MEDRLLGVWRPSDRVSYIRKGSLRQQKRVTDVFTRRYSEIGEMKAGDTTVLGDSSFLGVHP